MSSVGVLVCWLLQAAGRLSTVRCLIGAVALVLGFVGGKILADFVGYHVPTDWSLGIVASILGVGVGASLLSPGTKADAE
jgi:predicted tellurium resistance membrane protein TerC